MASSPSDQKVLCPKCKKPTGIVVSEHFGIQTLFCPGCDRSWDRKRPVQ
jgi:hypothetical protein